MLPSSQTSLPTRLPSPHTDKHVSLASIWPPEHTNPTSIWQDELHPSPSIVLLSSHCSLSLHKMRIPSPHLGTHVSTPPTPLPSVLDEVHAQPYSMRQSESQPSAPAVLLSSQISAVCAAKREIRRRVVEAYG